MVVSTRALRHMERVGETGICVQSGVSTGKLLSCATQWQLGGLEFLGGVPGSVGGGMVVGAGWWSTRQRAPARTEASSSASPRAWAR